MEKDQYERYEYARRRIKQKKNLYIHFVLLVLGSLFLYIANVFMNIGAPHQWYIWAIIVWVFIFIFHFIKVFITDRFMNKNWEKNEIEKLVAKQQEKIKQLQAEIDSSN